jgi:hypothetical protein
MERRKAYDVSVAPNGIESLGICGRESPASDSGQKQHIEAVEDS